MAAFFCCAITASAQETQTDRNRTYRITLGNVQYAHHDEKYDQGVTATPTSILDGITVLYSDGTKSKPKMDVTLVEVSSSDYSYAVPKSKLVDYLSIFRTEVNIMTIQLAL